MYCAVAFALALASVAQPAGNPRATRAAFDRIQCKMPSKDIDAILGKGTLVEDADVLHAMGSQPGATGDPYESVEGGLWLKWKGKESTIYIQFAGPTVVQNRDGTYAIGPNTEASMILFITEKQSIQRDVVTRDIHIVYQWRTARGEIRRQSKSRQIP